MSELRRRVFGAFDSGDSTPISSRDASPAPDQKDGGEYKVIPKKKFEKLREVRRSGNKRRTAWIFALGGVFGIFIAGFFASNTGHLDRLVDMAGFKEMNIDSLFDVLPAGLIKDVQDIQVSERDAGVLD